MRAEITTKEISERFGKRHNDVIRDIRGLIGGDALTESLFIDDHYISTQNKKINMLKMSAHGFCILTDGRNYSKGDNAYIKSEILKEFGEKFSVTSYSKRRCEDLFYDRLSKFIPNQEIIRQYPIGKYKVDFYINGIGLIIEYDESYHSAVSSKERDRLRFSEINKHTRENIDDGVNMIRIDSSREDEGLMLIASYMCLNATSELCEYYGEYESLNPEHSAK